MPTTSQDEFDLATLEAPRYFPYYAYREPGNCELFADLGPVLSLSKGHVVKAYGRTQHCYLVMSGALAATIHSDNPSMYQSAFFLEGSLFMESSALSGLPASLSFRALEPTTIMRIARDDLKRAMSRRDEVFDAVMRSTAMKLFSTQEQLRETMTLDVRGRIYYMLLGIAATCGKNVGKGWVALTIKVTQQQMSDMLGVNRVTVNTALQDLYARDVVRKDLGFYSVYDPKHLALKAM